MENAEIILKNLASRIGLAEDQLGKLGTDELPLDNVLDNFKRTTLESEALKYEKVQKAIEDERRKGMLATKGILDSVIGDDETKAYWTALEKITDPNERLKSYFGQVKTKYERAVEMAKANASVDAKTWQEAADKAMKDLQDLNEKIKKYEEEVIPSKESAFKQQIEEMKLQNFVWTVYTTSNIDFKTDKKRTQDFQLYFNELKGRYDFVPREDGSLQLFHKGKNAIVSDAKGTPLTLKDVIEGIADERGELIKNNGSGASQQRKQELTPEEQKRQQRTQKYGGSVGLS